MTKYQSKNLHRTVLLYGPPGTGKTTAIREFVNNSGLSSLRIPVGFLNTSSYMSAILRIIQPDIIIIDDFDRVNDQGKMLDLLTDFKKVSKCVLLSCNSLKLSEALLRPGRIDEIIEHRVLNKEVIDRVLGPYISYCDDSIREWPIAYIEEFVKRADVLGIEDALTSFKELEERNRKANISWRKEDYVPDEDEEE
jgi:ATP-dependent 26S proteasome regulatory subunit